MNGVRSLPAVVGNQKQRVQAVSDGVLDGFVFGEGPVSAFVRQDPQAHGHRSCDARIRGPKGNVQQFGRIEDAEHPGTKQAAQSGSHHRNAKVFEGLHGLRLKAVFWDDGLELLRFRKIGILPFQGFSLEPTERNPSHINVEGFLDHLGVDLDVRRSHRFRNLLLLDGNRFVRRIDRQGVASGRALAAAVNTRPDKRRRLERRDGA
mmetsp:Transcript_7025/g.17184  ORF Transcript_7025/g.17184 Transcript_7025/m.17184 type:complete len:206 (+) Transcript_7025:861-1478(+)